jgi:hypothetical protein
VCHLFYGRSIVDFSYQQAIYHNRVSSIFYTVDKSDLLSIQTTSFTFSHHKHNFFTSSYLGICIQSRLYITRISPSVFLVSTHTITVAARSGLYLLISHFLLGFGLYIEFGIAGYFMSIQVEYILTVASYIYIYISYNHSPQLRTPTYFSNLFACNIDAWYVK